MFLGEIRGYAPSLGECTPPVFGQKISVRLILQGKISFTGVHTSVIPEIYKPVLEELEQLGIHFTEKREPLKG